MTGIMQVMMGSGGGLKSLLLTNATVDGVAYTDGVSSFSFGVARIRVRTDGVLVLENTDGTGLNVFANTTPSSQWASPLPVTGDYYEAQLTVTSGTAPSGAATATFLTLSTERLWTLTGLSSTNAGSQSGVYSLTIRNRFNTAQTVTATFTLSAQNRSTP